MSSQATLNLATVDQAKEITKQIEEEEDVPLNDPFVGNEGTSSTNVNIPEEEQQDQFSLYNYKIKLNIHLFLILYNYYTKLT